MTAFILPDLGEGLKEADLVKWLIQEGQHVETDELVLLVETAKAVVELPAPVSGVITRLAVEQGETVKVGQILFEYDELKSTNTAIEQSNEAQNILNAELKKSSVSVVGELSKSSSQETNIYEIENSDASSKKLGKTNDSHITQETNAQNIVNEPICLNAFKESKTRKPKLNDARKLKDSLASVSPRTMAFAKTLDLEELFEHTYYGEMTLQDLLTIYKEKHNAKPQTQACQEEHVPLKGVRKVMAQVMTQSHKEIPAATIFEDADISHWPLQADITLAVIKGISTACKLVPVMNASYDPENMTVETHHDVNLGLAVNSEHGLYVPVIRQAQDKNKNELRQNINQLREQISTQKISPKELQGATISLSNFGVLSGRYATPIIVPPQVCIVGIGKKREEPIARNGKLSAGTVLPISISFDHRVATGAEAAKFMQCLIDVLKTEY